jgi:sugar/nucleoside kinase (ribokinase family)
MKMGVDALRALYKRTTIFFCNKEEAMRILKTPETDLKTLMKMLADLGPKIVVITDGIKGAYAFDGTDTWFMPVYPQDPYERTGAGDAFASSVTAALALGLPLYEALRWGPANSAGVIQKIGAQEGLQTRKELEKMLERAPADYHPIKV